MPLQLGLAYALVRPTPLTSAVLVLTNDLWNARMQEVAVIPLSSPRTDVSALAPIIWRSPPLQAFSGRPLSVPRNLLGEAILRVPGDRLAAVEDALCEVLGLTWLFRDPPALPPTPPGPITYPHWGQMCYVSGQQYSGEAKRYVVVSHDRWNSVAGTAIAVRTTTQQRRPARAFPEIEHGGARACCGNASSFATRRFELRRQPQPGRLSLNDMLAIARGIIETHQLGAALERLASK